MIDFYSGIGFYIGIELICDLEQRKPAINEAKWIQKSLKDKHIIISLDGPEENVLKFKPPMCFNEKDAEKLISDLDSTLTEMKLMNGNAPSSV